MSRMRLSKKFKPCKKAWKNLSNTLQSKFNKIDISKSLKAALQYLISLFHSLTHLITSKGTHRSITSSRSYATTSNYYHVQHKNFATIQINELCNKSSSNNSIHHVQGETSRESSEKVHGDKNNKNSDINTIEDAWKAVVAKSPMMQVDQKAEEFIYKFREDMRLQKEKSLLEFHERLARST
ncbi:uncharacterized protein [Cicer arietinum]|uniref:Uncharacterized protein LOC101498608 n=1 Tax=Cicer arietinum TaxID=3827 RepID=A0A1S2Y1H2_CICAR|nr:uncharacterized protein LOC101498608 [Cicer arietinum]